jgi:hypothetical protein
MNPEILAQSINALESYLGGDPVENYSGRSMFGKTCPAFQYETEKQAIVSMISAMNCDDKADRDVLEMLFYGHAIESLGKGVVLYFPKLAVDK